VTDGGLSMAAGLILCLATPGHWSLVGESVRKLVATIIFTGKFMDTDC